MSGNGSWSPSKEGVVEIARLLRMGQDPRATNEVHRAVQQQLAAYDTPENVDFVKYLAFVFGTEDVTFQAGLVTTPNDPSDFVVRQIAGLLLKTSIKRRSELGGVANSKGLDEPTLRYVQSIVVPQLGSSMRMIRSTAGIIVATIVRLLGEKTAAVWPDLLPALGAALDNYKEAEGSAGHNAVDGAFGALEKMCEDAPEVLDCEASGRPLNSLVPKWLAYFQHPTTRFRRAALACVNSFIMIMPGVLASKIEDFLRGLSLLTQDRDAGVRKEVCTGLVCLLEMRTDVVYPHLSEVTGFMLNATNDEDEAVALEACEFWSVFCDCPPEGYAVLRAQFPVLIPTLLSKMVYSEMDLMMMTADEEDHESVPDRPENIKPSFHKTALKGTSGDDDDDDDGGGENFDEAQWNLRKCAASSLDHLSTTFQDEILPHLLPHLQERLSHAEWPVRESAILALGAIAEGCRSGLEPHLPQLYPFLLNLLTDEQSLIRSIACWTMSRFFAWLAEADEGTMLPATIEKLCERVLDSSKRVQRSGCSSLSILLEEMPEGGMVPYMEPVVRTLCAAYAKYQLNNMRVLYDSIATLAETCGAHLNDPKLLEFLMPPLCSKWSQIDDADAGLAPLLETFGAIAVAIGPGFAPFAPTVFKRCVELIKTGVISILAGKEVGEWVDREVIVCALDALSNVVEGLGGAAESLFQGAELVDLIFECAKDEGSDDLRQSGLAVLGDLAKSCIRAFKEPQIPVMFNILLANMTPEYVNVCNNALWCTGELISSVGAPMRPFVPAAIEKISSLFNHPVQLEKSIKENAAAAMGRLALCDAAAVGRHLPLFFKTWCLAATLVQDEDEKLDAYRGLCSAIQADPTAALDGNDFGYLCAAFVSYGTGSDIPQDLGNGFTMLLRGIQEKIVSTGRWGEVFGKFPPALKEDIEKTFHLGWR